jgi:para-nitrobenzyl esterase|tara:strand:- start:3393 stop:5012 length:1620 start_codon:yes stop_codon:yes gene_type:complete
MKYLLLLIVFAPLLLSAQCDKGTIIASNDIGIVETESGKVRGYIEDGIYTYKGIPYAYAERFMKPGPAKPWEDVRFMGYYGATAPLDLEAIKARGNGAGMFAMKNDWGYPHEDCQSLNIWTPNINDNKKRPVIFWIHGGGYEYGSSHELPFYDGKNLSKKGDVVYVSVNHRLNILGFLDLSQYGEKYKYSANVGLLDLVASLKWVKNSIANFGGDPDNITVFGQSGGGGKITALLNSPVADGLFQQAIVMSGSFAQQYQTPKMAQKVSSKVLKELDIKESKVDEIQKVPYDVLLRAGKRALAAIAEEAKAKGEAFPRLGWGPVADDYFLPYPMFGKEVLKQVDDVNIIIGTTKTEFAVMAAMMTGEDMEATKSALKMRYKDKADTYMEAVRKAYPDTKKASDYMAIDLMFRPGAIRDANKLVKGGHKNTYMYVFTWESPINDGGFKSMHCMELPFVFNNIELGREMTGGGEEAYKLADIVSGAWINFARFGNPSAKGLPTWPKYTKEGATMILDVDSEVKYHFDKELMEIAMPDLMSSY